MLRRNTTRHDHTNWERTPRQYGGALRGSGFARQAAPVLLAVLSVLPFAYAQHGNHGGGTGYHQSSPHMSAPSRPMQSAPHGYAAPPARYQGAPAQANRPANSPENRPMYAPGMNGPVSQPQRPIAAPAGNAFVGPQQGPRNQYAVPPARGGQHLSGWLQNHQGQSFAGQENSLRQEPGFNRLPQPQQQRLIDRLHQLNSMSPEQRQRTLGRNENMERLSPDRREAVRSSAQELSGMDIGRRQQVRGAFRSLRDLPPNQRQQTLNSPEYRSQYSDHERQILGNLLSVEPYSPR